MLVLVADCYGNLIHIPLRENLKEIRAGSLPENNIYLPYKGVSRHHFSLTHKRHQWMLRDLESKNGTCLNGKRIHTSPIAAGDTIQAGIIRFSVHQMEEESDPILLSSGKPDESTADLETDKVGDVAVENRESIYSFPKLVLPPGSIIGKSPAMRNAFQKLHSLVDSVVNVLLIGETGVGKEMFAQTLHLSGKRASGAFVPVNCAAIPTELAESELFGIGEGVATNVSQREGKIAFADGGTLFLDELSSFPLTLQAKILRAIEDRLIYPVGENKPQKVNFRLIAATNQNPLELVRAGKLREDLYHRLATVEIQIPPLRERTEDLSSLILGLLRQISEKEDKKVSGLTKRLYAALCTYSYPGNVRELVNILHGMVALASPGELLDITLLPQKVLAATLEQPVDDLIQTDVDQTSVRLHETLDEMTRRLIHQAFQLYPNNYTRAARYLNVTPFGLRKMMKRLGIEKPSS